MSSAVLKAKLRAARVALDNKDFQSARDASLQVLEYEPDNYFAYVPPACAAISPFDNLQ
jgi:superkiller protein 3